MEMGFQKEFVPGTSFFREMKIFVSSDNLARHSGIFKSTCLAVDGPTGHK